jgi:hypothetical protein
MMSNLRRNSPQWRRDQQEKIAWANFDAAFIDYCCTQGAANSLDGLGVAYSYLTPVQFLARFGAAPNPRVDPGPAAGNAIQLTQWKVDFDGFRKQQELLDETRTCFVGPEGVPQHLLEPLKVNRSLHGLTLSAMRTALVANLGVLNAHDLTVLHASLEVPYVHPGQVAVFIAEKLQTHEDLAAANQALPEMQKNRFLFENFESIAGMEQCFTDFRRLNNTVALQTTPALAAAIIAYVENVLPSMATKRSLGLSASTVPPSELIQANIQNSQTVTIADIERIVSQALSAQLKVPSQVAKNTPFCWTHGDGATCTMGAHWGRKCQAKAPGHKNEATWANLMNSKHWRTKNQHPC